MLCTLFFFTPVSIRDHAHPDNVTKTCSALPRNLLPAPTPPRADVAAKPVLPTETVTVDGAEYIVVREGTAKMLFPIAGDVFYNPVQEMNRDMSIAILNRFSKM